VGKAVKVIEPRRHGRAVEKAVATDKVVTAPIGEVAVEKAVRREGEVAREQCNGRSSDKVVMSELLMGKVAWGGI
jgi:hypothetical protein